MDILVYSPSYKLLGFICNATSLQWRRVYAEPGDFELHVPLTYDNLELLAPDNLVVYKGAKEAGVVESIQLSESAGKKEAIVKGRFLISVFDRRILRDTYNYSGNVEDAVYNICSHITPVPEFRLWEHQNIPKNISFQATNKNALDVWKKILASTGCGLRAEPRFYDGYAILKVYDGVNHSVNQTKNNHVIFSEEYSNLAEATYDYNSQQFKNIAIVGGEGEGSARVFVEVGDTTSTGLARRELFVDAKDIRKEDLTDAEYKAKLEQKGFEELAKANLASSFDCKTLPNVNFVYKKDYDLGDIVTVIKDNWHLTIDKRITAINEVYEHEQMTCQPTLGDPLPTAVKWDD